MLFVFVFAIKLLLVCYSACSLSLNTFAFEEIIYRNKEIEISSTDINMTSPEEGRKWFSRSVASMTNICSWGTRFTMIPVLVCVIKITHLFKYFSCLVYQGSVQFLDEILDTLQKHWQLLQRDSLSFVDRQAEKSKDKAEKLHFSRIVPGNIWKHCWIWINCFLWTFKWI